MKLNKLISDISSQSGLENDSDSTIRAKKVTSNKDSRYDEENGKQKRIARSKSKEKSKPPGSKTKQEIVESIQGPELVIYPVKNQEKQRLPKEMVSERLGGSGSLDEASVKTLAFLVKEKW